MSTVIMYHHDSSEHHIEYGFSYFTPRNVQSSKRVIGVQGQRLWNIQGWADIKSSQHVIDSDQ